MKARIFLLLVLYSSQMLAVQNLTITESVPIRVAVSQDEINMLTMQGDRIESLAIPGSVEVEQNNKTGSAYLRFKKRNIVKGFLTSESGTKYQIEFVPSQIPAENITFIKSGTDNPSSAHDSREYTQMLAQLLRAMFNQENIEGYNKSVLNKSDKYNKKKVVLTGLYSGQTINGLIYEYENTSDEIQDLTELDFYDIGVRAVAIDNKTLYSGDIAKIYIMRDKS